MFGVYLIRMHLCNNINTMSVMPSRKRGKQQQQQRNETCMLKQYVPVKTTIKY